MVIKNLQKFFYYINRSYLYNLSYQLIIQIKKNNLKNVDNIEFRAYYKNIRKILIENNNLIFLLGEVTV